MLFTIFMASITAGTSLLFATLGEIITERSGIINLGLEGIMLMGAMTGFVASHYSGYPVVGLFVAAFTGMILSCIHSLVVITFKSNQIVSGLALTILGTGMSSFFGKRMIGKTAPGFSPLFLDFDVMVFIAFAASIALWFFLKYTRWGLNLNSVGQNPGAADATGINVYKIRYTAVIFGGAMTGIGGAYLSLVYTQMWVENMVSGRGWIAIALVIFSTWNPLKALLGAYLFGAVMATILRIQAVGIDLPIYILSMAPYVVTIITLIVITAFGNIRKHIGAPEALGKVFSR
ncbi:ABC transporter permease [Candidatus Poribacteria bacterium]|nr:ABC transporter permease [Candidatus Poribacteria bacterium]